MARKVPHDLTIVAFQQDRTTGAFIVVDIVETSFKYAPKWFRRFRNDSSIVCFNVCRPGKLSGRPFYNFHHLKGE